MNQLIIRIMNHKKNKFKQNLKFFKTESISDLKSDNKNNSNSNSNSRRLRTDSKEKKNLTIETKLKSAITITKLIMIKQSTNEKTENFNTINERKFTNLKFNIEREYMRLKIRQRAR